VRVRVQAARQAHAYLTSLDRICRQLLDSGHDPASLCAVKLIDVPPSPERGGLVRGRVALGMTTLPQDPLMVDELGDAITADELGYRLVPAIGHWPGATQLGYQGA
jgi:hypothetical protein